MVSLSVNCFLFLLCILLLLPKIAISGLEKWIYPRNDHFPLAEATAFIARKFLSKATNTVVIKELSLDPKTTAMNGRILEHILINLHDTIAVQLYNGQTANQPWDYYIFIVDSSEAFDKIRWNFPETYYERDFRFVIVLTKFSPGFFFTLARIFSSCRRFHVIDANVILHHPSLGICMFKYDIFTSKRCSDVQPYPYFCFKDGVDNLKAVFPRKLLNFHGCPINITARLNPPFLTFSGDKNNPDYQKNSNKLGGIEGELLKLLSRHLNFTINLLPFPKERTFFVNYTAFGCFKELVEHRAEIAIGGFSASNPKRLVLTQSETYQISPVVFIVRIGREVDPLSRLKMPFEWSLWIILTAFLILSGVSIRFLQITSQRVQTFVFGENIDSPMTNFIMVFLGYPITRPPVRNFARFVLLLWLLMSLVLRNAYQGSMFDSLRTDKFTRIPENYEDLMKWKYKIVVSKYFEDSETFPNYTTVVIGSGHERRLRFLEHERGRFATIVIRDNFMSYLEDNYRNGSKLVMVKEPVFMNSAVMFFPKHSMYAKVVSRYFRNFADSGVNDFISKKNSKDKTMFWRYKEKKNQLEPLTCYRLLGVFEISGGLLIVACVVFVMEVLSVHCRRIPGLIQLQW